MTLPEYTLLMQAVQLKHVDLEYELHLQAYLNFAAQAKKKAGKNKEKPVFRTFKQFFDYEKAVDRVIKKDKKDDKFLRLSKFIKDKNNEKGGQ